MTRDLAVRTTGLTKAFRGRTAVEGLDLAVPRASVFGFLGPNGSGKTTTIRMLLGLIAPSAGRAEVLGASVPGGLARVLPRVGTLVEGPAFYPFLTGRATLHRLDAADPSGTASTRRQRVGDALERVGLGHASEKKVHAYSLGMKQRLSLAAALLAPRDLMVLDEPTNGLDPQGTREVRALVRSLAAEGTTVFVSSHLLAEVEQVCTHAAVLRQGRLVAQGTLDGLRGAARPRLEILTPDTDLAASALEPLGLVQAPSAPGSLVVVASGPADDGGLPPEAVVAALVAAGVRVRGFSASAGSLEERFVELTGEGFDVGP